jgi:hypothetical protein
MQAPLRQTSNSVCCNLLYNCNHSWDRRHEGERERRCVKGSNINNYICLDLGSLFSHSPEDGLSDHPLELCVTRLGLEFVWYISKASSNIPVLFLLLVCLFVTITWWYTTKINLTVHHSLWSIKTERERENCMHVRNFISPKGWSVPHLLDLGHYVVLWDGIQFLDDGLESCFVGFLILECCP